MLGGSLVSSKYRGDRAALAVTQDHHQRHGQMVHGVFDGADLIRGRDVAGHPDHEDIADALVEDDFRRRPGVGTGEDRGQGVLALGRGQGPAGPVLVGMLEFALHVTGIARLEDPHGLIRRDPRIGAGRQGGRCQGRGHYEDKHCQADSLHKKLL